MIDWHLLGTLLLGGLFALAPVRVLGSMLWGLFR